MKSDYELSLRDYIAIIKDRALVLGVSAAVILAATVAVALMVPPLYQFRVRSRVFRWYGRLREIEDTVESEPDKAPQMLQALDALEAQVEKVTVPLSYADELYALRNHIHLIRKKLMRP